MALGWLFNAYSSHSIHGGKRFKLTKSMGLVMGTKGGLLWSQRRSILGLVMGSKGVGTWDVRGWFYN